jgi:hypothetical protein
MTWKFEKEIGTYTYDGVKGKLLVRKEVEATGSVSHRTKGLALVQSTA